MAAAVALASFSLSHGLGGESITARFRTLIEDDPVAVYYSSGRAGWLIDFSNNLTEFPFGAGLGRWGMMRYYFGDPANWQSPAIFTELQFNAWILDGGFILPMLYCCALLITVVYEFRMAGFARGQSSGPWTAAAVAVNAGSIALVFGFTPFTTQTGLQYWFLAGALHAVAQARTDSPPWDAASYS
jgi:hypothetical protein